MQDFFNAFLTFYLKFASMFNIIKTLLKDKYSKINVVNDFKEMILYLRKTINAQLFTILN